jgi:hypothetical protein
MPDCVTGTMMRSVSTPRMLAISTRCRPCTVPVGP